MRRPFPLRSALPGIELFEALERLVQRDQRFTLLDGGDGRVLEIDALLIAAASRGAVAARVIDQDAPHRLRRDGKEVRPILECRARLFGELEIGLVNERRRR